MEVYSSKVRASKCRDLFNKSACLFIFSFLFINLHVHAEVNFNKQYAYADSSNNPIYFGDPFILLHKGTYYAYGTSNPNGIDVYTSDDLLNWKQPKQSMALKKGDVWGEKWFWAPEVHYYKGKFYMFYTAEEHICVAVADHPLGPFTQEVKEPMIANEKCIDNSLFVDNGKPYMLYDRFNDGLNVWIAELEPNLLKIKPGTEKPCIHVSQKWEEVWPRVNEGPFVIKHKGKYYMTYSGNSYESPFYGIGYASSDKITGPWVKYAQNPILQKPKNLVGVGHSATFKDKNGNWRVVFHAHHSQSKIHPRIMYISTITFKNINNEEVMQIDSNYLTPRLIKD